VAAPRPLLRMSVSRTGASAVLRLRGEADVSVVPRLRLRLADLVEPSRAEPVDAVVVDLAALEFLDLAALTVLLDAGQAMRQRGGELVLRSPHRSVQRLLELTSAHRHVHVER
jgi:anti-anti-sigma factor